MTATIARNFYSGKPVTDNRDGADAEMNLEDETDETDETSELVFGPSASLSTAASSSINSSSTSTASAADAENNSELRPDYICAETRCSFVYKLGALDPVKCPKCEYRIAHKVRARVMRSLTCR